MLYITSLVLIYKWKINKYNKLCAFWLASSNSPPPPASGNHKSDLFFYEFICLIFEARQFHYKNV